MNELNLLSVIEKYIEIPNNFRLVSVENKIRNNKEISIYRLQNNKEFSLNGPRITLILNKAQSIESFKNYSICNNKKLLSADEAKLKAIKIFKSIDCEYATGLSFMRIEKQSREIIENGKNKVFTVQWIKFSHSNGSYNWVTLGGDGEIIEIERNSYWDYAKGRRKTEMWDNDDWVLARKKLGPQLPAPNALA